MKTEEKLNMTMLCDFYELTMGNGYFQTGFKDRITYFDVYFRSVPDGGGFAIAAGLEQLIEYIEDLHFDEQDIAYLRGKGIFCEEFLEYLRTFRFTGDIYAVPEGTPVFPKEPMVIVRAPAIEAQLVETFALLTVNHQSLIATKANRIARPPPRPPPYAACLPETPARQKAAQPAHIAGDAAPRRAGRHRAERQQGNQMTPHAAPALPCVAFLLHFARIMLLESVKNLFQNGLNRVILITKYTN